MVGEGVGMLFSQWLLFSTPFWASPCLPSSHTNCFSPGFSYTFTVCALPLLLFCILTAHSINSCSYLVFSIFMLKYKNIPKLCHCNSVSPEFLFTLKASKFWISESDRTRSRSSFTGLKLRNDDLYILNLSTLTDFCSYKNDELLIWSLRNSHLILLGWFTSISWSNDWPELTKLIRIEKPFLKAFSKSLPLYWD